MIMSQREDALKFETGRIKALQEERLHIQKKTFTKWMNSFLVKARMEVEDLFTDLADGKKLLKLLEIISGEKLGKANHGRMRVHKIENVNKSLAFLHTKVRLESIGAEDIVDGNPRLILGLIWTIILRFQIQEIEIEVDEENESSEKKSAKDALLLWCQRKTNGYQNVNIQDFTGSWRSGLGFNALIHAHRPDLIDYNGLIPTKHLDNLNNAFDTAERSLGIPRLLDAEDIDVSKPDEKSVLTYVASYYHTFAQMYNKDKSGRRIANIISQIKEADDLKYKYELDGKSLLTWIRKTITELNSRDFPNNLEGVQKLLQKFKEHITVHKPPKYNEKSEIEANYFIINTRLKELNQHVYTPPEGLLVHDIERAWEELEKSEYQRELALREEVIRQTNLEQLAIRFEKKSLLREGYLKDMIQVLSDPRYGINLAQVEATLKKHEAISADILAREQRCEQLVTMADYLVKEQYHDCEAVRARADEITKTWNQLIKLLENHKVNLERFSVLMQLVRDVDTIVASINELEEQLVSEDVGVHLIGVEDLLHTHSLVESQISSMGDTIKKIAKTAGGFTGKELSMVGSKITTMNDQYEKVLKSCKERRCKLEDSKSYYQFVQDCEEEEAWVNEKSIVCSGPVQCKDLRGVVSLIGSHKVLLDEIKARKGNVVKIVERGNELVRVWQNEGGGDNKNVECKDVEERIKSLESRWGGLNESADRRSKKLNVVLEAFQFYSDANETDSWITEKRPLVSSLDYGSDEPSAQALLQRHVNLQEEIIAYEVDVKGLNTQADKLVQAGINSIVELSETSSSATPLLLNQQQRNGIDEYVTEQKLVPQDYWEDEVVEKTDFKTITEERAVPQVKALYAFSGQDIEISKGEVMFLLSRTNSDWWSVRKANGEDGFVPANYVKEIEPKVVMVQVRKPEVVKETKRVKKTRMVLQTVQKPKRPPPPPTSTMKKSQSSSQQLASSSSSTAAEPILTRTQRINTDYNDIKNLSATRKRNLQESIKLFQFMRECDDFEKWINEKKKYLSTPEPNVQAAKRAFEKFLTDLSASSSRISQIDELVKQFEGSNNTTVEKVHHRAQKVKQMYNELLKLKGDKEKTLEGALSVELFNRTCEEVLDWMSEKMMQIETDEWRNNDLKTVQALQRKHNNLEREISPIQEKVQRVSLLAESVKKTYPSEEENVDSKKHEVIQKWEQLVNKADGRKHALEHAVGFQIFDQGVKSLVSYVRDVKSKMNAYVRAKDVTSAEEALKVHSDIGDEIKAKSSEFDELISLGDKIGVTDKVELLTQERSSLNELYAEKSDWLNQVLDLQVFLREADHIDRNHRNHLQVVQSKDVGTNLDEVELLIKRHNDFESTLVAQDERLNVFDSMGEKLIEAGHFEQELIKEKRANIVENNAKVKELGKLRKEELLRSLKYHEFYNDVEETLSWVDEKIAVAKDESFKDLTNIDKKLKRHEAFAGELRANEVRIKNIRRTGEKLLEVVPEKQHEINDSVKKLSVKWDELVRLSEEKYDKLRQAEAQANFNKNLEGVLDRLVGIKNNLANKGTFGDRRSCKEAVKRANSLSSELSSMDSKIKELEKVADEMQTDNHFDSDGVKEKVGEARALVDQLRLPVEQLKEELGNAYHYYNFLHELDAEASWIREKLALVGQESVAQDLYQAQTNFKKHKKIDQEVANHEPVVVKLVEKGKAFEGDEVKAKIREFEGLWSDLKAACANKSKKLELSLKAQQFFFDIESIESWIDGIENVLVSNEFGNDIHNARVLLTKHKTIELEMDSYGGILNEIKFTATQMVNSGHPDKTLISAKVSSVDEHMNMLRKIGNDRREKLIRRVGVLEYFSEVDEFINYLDETFGRETSSNDYGVDYEHLTVLKGRFRDVELKVDGVNERFKVLEALGDRLSSVEEEFTFVKEKWNNMLALMAAREQKLHAAGEIHAFNRDVADSLARISEKLNSIPDTLGRDFNSCEGMLRQHEAFENDLLALEAQLQVLVDDAARLQTLYPTNAQNIRQEQALVIESWNNLQTRATLRKEQLQNAVDFWRFSAEYANLTSFINSLLTTLPSQPKVRDTASSQALMNEHEMIKGEIDAREDQFEKVLKLGDAMVQEGHPETAEVTRMINNLTGLRDKLIVAWEHKKVYLDQLIDLNIFLRDAKQLETLCNSQEVALSGDGSSQLGDVESVDHVMKKHEAFEKLLLTQEEKFSMLEVQGMKLVRQNHFDSPTVREKLAEVKSARELVKMLCMKKRKALEDKSKYVRFLRDVNETVSWVDEKISNLQLDESVNKDLSLSEKIKKLKKHQAFSAEVNSNKARVLGLFALGEELGGGQPELKVLTSRWGELVRLVKEFGDGLEEAQDILEFTNQCELTDAWVREKESLVRQGSVGDDYEECCEIRKRVDDFDSEVKVDDERIQKLNSLAQRLIKSSKSDSQVVHDTITNLNSRWSDLKVGLEGYREKLSKALLLHKFNRDAEEVEERIKNVRGLISGDVGRDLEHCETLVRKHEGVEVQVRSIGDRVSELERERGKLIESGVDGGSLKRIDEMWMDLSVACLEKTNALTSSLDYHKFLKKFNDLKRYIESTVSKVVNTNLGSNVQEAEEAVKTHEEVTDNVAAREVVYNELVRVGKRFVVEHHEYSNEFGERVQELQGLWGKLGDALKAMSVKVDQSLKMQRLFSKIGDLEVEIQLNEAFLSGRELGETLGAVIVLLRRHEDFINAFGALEKKVSELIQQGESLLSKDHFDAAAIKSRMSELQSKLEKLKQKAHSRSQVLHESYELHKFVLEIHEIETYALEKLKIALDDNYSDMVNLQSKIQRHAAFESEVQANYERITDLMTKSESLLKHHDDNDDEHEESVNNNPLHSFMVEIQKKLDNVQLTWKELLAASTLKRERLLESYQALLFNQGLEDIESWMDELEQQLESDDHGVDLESVRVLINKWMHLESEFLHKKDVIGGVSKTADAFVKANHYLADEIRGRVDGIKARYSSLSEPLHIRRENLEETNKFFEFLRDVGEEREWIDEKLPSVGVDAELGANLTQVQSLQKKHNQLESEIISHEPLVGSLVTRSAAMVRSNHFASDQIQSVTRQLQERFQELKDSAAVRRLRLADSMLSQTFYDEANELLSWMSEKSTYVNNMEFKDCENVSGLLKRLDAFQRDLTGFRQRIDKVLNTGDELVNRGHFDSDNINAKKQEVSHEYSELQKMSDKKKLRVSDAMKYYEFNKLCNECIDWINDLMGVAGSEEYGRDVEHCELIMQKFESFYSNVQESRVQAVHEMADELVEEGYPNVERVRGRANEVKCIWDEFKELAQARLEALQGAKQVHAFDRRADETISWITEKHGVVCSEEYGSDLSSIQSLIRKHGAFENDLKSLVQQVNEVREEATRLRSLFVDASEHINVKLNACEDAWKELVERTRTRGDKLHQAENLQAYFDDYTNLMAFVNELVAKVTSDELGRTVRAAEASLAKNESYLKEIESFKGVDDFCKRGEELIAKGHFMMDEINDKIKSLRSRWDYLNSVARERNDVFHKNLDLRVYLVQVDDFDKWMKNKEVELKDYELGDSIREVEELITTHEEFARTLEAQESKLEGLRRKTLIEEAWLDLKKREQLERENLAKEYEKARVEGLKRKEVDRIKEDKEDKINNSGSSNVRGGFLGGSRFGSLVFGGGRRGSEPISPSSPPVQERNGNTTSPLKITLTPPASLENIACSPQQQQQQQDQPLLSRSESLRLLNTTSSHDAHDTSTLKKPKRTPSFTTRRRTASFRRKKNPENLPPVEIEGYLERKHELQSSGKRAAVRSWKHYYVLLCGQLLCFFKDQEDFELNKVGSNSPISIYKCLCAAAVDYTKRKFVFRVKPLDGSEFLFAADSQESMDNWIRKINFHAQLEPKDQLIPEGQEQSRVSMQPPPPPPPKTKHYDSTSTDDDEPVVQQHNRKPKSRSSLHHPRSREPIYAEDTQLDGGGGAAVQQPVVQLRNSAPPGAGVAAVASKPPIPPRSSSIVNEQQNGRSPVKNGGGGDAVDNQQYFVHSPQGSQRPVSVDRSPVSPQQPQPPQPHHLSPRSSGSLPPGMSLGGTSPHHHDNSSSENENAGGSVHSSSPSPHAAEHDGKKKKEGSSGLMGLFRRKKATQL